MYSRTLVSSQPRYSASMDSRVDALMRVRSGGSRSGTHSYSSDRSASQPGGMQAALDRRHRLTPAFAMTCTPAPEPDTTYRVPDASSKAREFGCCTVG